MDYLNRNRAEIAGVVDMKLRRLKILPTSVQYFSRSTLTKLMEQRHIWDLFKKYVVKAKGLDVEPHANKNKMKQIVYFWTKSFEAAWIENPKPISKKDAKMFVKSMEKLWEKEKKTKKRNMKPDLKIDCSSEDETAGTDKNSESNADETDGADNYTDLNVDHDEDDESSTDSLREEVLAFIKQKNLKCVKEYSDNGSKYYEVIGKKPFDKNIPHEITIFPTINAKKTFRQEGWFMVCGAAKNLKKDFANYVPNHTLLNITWGRCQNAHHQ